MVKQVMVSFVVLGLALSVDAIGLIGRSRGYRPAAQVINDGGASERKRQQQKKNAAERQVREKARTITIQKLDSKGPEQLHVLHGKGCPAADNIF